MTFFKGAVHTCILIMFLNPDLVSAKCERGHATCHEVVGRASWCQSQVNTCHGNPEIKCYCESTTTRKPLSTLMSAGLYRNHAKCHHEVGAHSWCKENLTCHGGSHVFCGGEAPALTPSPSATTTSKPTTPSQTSSHASIEIPILSGHALCKSHKASSWCKEDGTCHNLPDVHCGAPKGTRNRILATFPPLRHSHGESGGRKVRPTPYVNVYEAPSISRPFILWTEWPTMTPGNDWKAYFDKLLSFLRENCAGIQVTRLVMRVLHPQFQQQHGPLWQTSHQSSFFKDFMMHLPDNVEVSMYPYLKEAHALGNWTGHTGAPAPLEGVFKFVKMWNDFLSRHHVSHRIRGIVTDYEDGDNFQHHMIHLASYKRRYSSPGQASLRFGIALGYESAGKIKSYGPEVNEVFLEMYDWYVEGSKPAIPVESHNLALNNPTEFLAMLDKNVWKTYIPFYSRHPNIIFLWSLQNRLSNDCLYPDIGSKSCGDRVDFGSWTPKAFHSFLDMLIEKYPFFGGQRQHGLFQFSYMPNSWATCAK